MTDVNYARQTVLATREWVPGKLFSFTASRPDGFNFTAGQFARLGLPASGEPGAEPSVWRAYSLVNAPHQSPLEFYAVVVPDGEFSPRLAALKPGDDLFIDRTLFGFLTIERFEPGGTLWLVATGTGLSAYLSMLNDPATWSSFERIILVHGVRTCAELAYQDQIATWQAAAGTAPFNARFTYLPIPTQETLPDTPKARLTTLIENGDLEHLAETSFDPVTHKIMLCGNPAMVTDARALLKDRGFAAGRRGVPGNLAVENYW